MSNRPANPQWATSATKTEPGAGKKASGFAEGDRYPAEYSNWLLGLFSDWFQWFTDGILTRADATDRTPVIGHSDPDGNVTQYVGPEGLTMGPAVHRIYEADTLDTLGASSGVTILNSQLLGNTQANCDGGQEVNALNETHGRYYLEVQNAATTEGAIIYRAQHHTNLDDSIIVIEAHVAMDAIGGNGVDVWFGLKEGATIAVPAGATVAHVCFVKEGGDTNWQCSSGDGTAQTRVDSGTPPVANTYQRLRIEYHGANTTLGLDNSTAPVTRFFIDGTLEAETTSANVPTDADAVGLFLMLGAAADGTGPASDFQIFSGPIKVAWVDQSLALGVPT